MKNQVFMHNEQEVQSCKFEEGTHFETSSPTDPPNEKQQWTVVVVGSLTRRGHV